MSENIEVTHDNQDWVEAYKELAPKLTALEDIKWAELWEEQPYLSEGDYPVPVPAVYLEFTLNETNETGNGGELGDWTVAVYLYYTDIADNYDGSWNQGDALRFAGIMRSIHRALQGQKGIHFSRLTRVAQQKLDTPHAGGRLHSQTYRFILSDNTAVKTYETDLGEDRAWSIGRDGIPPSAEESDPIYGDLGF